MSVRETPFLLVHGSWLGSWCWEFMQHELARLGATSSAIDLTGLQAIGHLPGEPSDFHTHVAEVVAHLRSLSAQRVILVGHSYGGAVASEAAALCPKEIEALVNLDGFLTRAGKNLYEVCPTLEQVASGLTSKGMPGYVLPCSLELLGMSDSEGETLIKRRLRAMPEGSNTASARFDSADLECRRIYIRFGKFPVFAETVEIAAREGWESSTLDVAHMAIMTDPELVTTAMVRALERRTS